MRGKIIKFKRRNVAESNIEGIFDLDKIYDYIRMLDADGNPKAFIAMHGVKYEYSRVQQKADASFTMVQYSYPIQRSLRVNDMGYMGMVYPEYFGICSQDLESIYHDAGQFYFVKVKELECQKTLWCKNTVPLILSELEVQDLDTMTDWQLAEMKFKLIRG